MLRVALWEVAVFTIAVKVPSKMLTVSEQLRVLWHTII